MWQSASADEIGGNHWLDANAITSPGRQRIVKLIGRQQTLQSSIKSCSRWEVSTSRLKLSPQCGQTTSAETMVCIGMCDFDFVGQAHRLPDVAPASGRCAGKDHRQDADATIMPHPIFWLRLHQVCGSAAAEHGGRHSAKLSPDSCRFGRVRLVWGDAPAGG